MNKNISDWLLKMNICNTSNNGDRNGKFFTPRNLRQKTISTYEITIILFIYKNKEFITNKFKT